jgi:hypothetical protein
MPITRISIRHGVEKAMDIGAFLGIVYGSVGENK